LYLSFKYKDIDYEGYALEVIEEGKSLYLFYIDQNILPRFTKLNHFKSIKDLKNNEIENDLIIKKLPGSVCNFNLFSHQARTFLEKTREKYKEIFINFENKRLDDENFNLKKYSRK